MTETTLPDADRSPLRIANFRAYWFSRLSMTLAQYAMMLIIGWQTYNIARDSGLGIAARWTTPSMPSICSRVAA